MCLRANARAGQSLRVCAAVPGIGREERIGMQGGLKAQSSTALQWRRVSTILIRTDGKSTLAMLRSW